MSSRGLGNLNLCSAFEIFSCCSPPLICLFFSLRDLDQLSSGFDWSEAGEAELNGKREHESDDESGDSETEPSEQVSCWAISLVAILIVPRKLESNERTCNEIY